MYATVTQKIIDAIEANPGSFILPWHKQVMGLPKNALTNNHYNGINTVSLWCMSMPSSTWATYRQWAELGAQVRKGERGSTIIYYSTFERDEGDETKRVPFIKHSSVFNASQVDGWQEPETPRMPPIERLEAVDRFVAGTGADIHHGGSVACYVPSLDIIRMPDETRFFDTDGRTESYYSTLCHELTHWTGHERRLHREGGKRFGDTDYAFEELVAELGAAFLCARLGITQEPREDHSAYIANWLKALKSDKRFIFSASAQAQLAVDYLLQSPAPAT